jgi:hypothetical protein
MKDELEKMRFMAETIGGMKFTSPRGRKLARMCRILVKRCDRVPPPMAGIRDIASRIVVEYQSIKGNPRIKL